MRALEALDMHSFSCSYVELLIFGQLLISVHYYHLLVQLGLLLEVYVGIFCHLCVFYRLI